MGRQCSVVGATGLIGRHLVERLRKTPDYEKVRVLVRRRSNLSNLSNLASDKVEERIVRFDDATSIEEALVGTEVFGCLGTTRKAAGSKEAFRAVDYGYTLRVAEAARRRGVEQFLLVSAVGASASSPVFYNRVKGETEDALLALGFLGGCQVLRPSLLLGPREEHRPGEALAVSVSRWTMPFYRGPLAKYRPIHADDVAAKMVAVALERGVGQPCPSRIFEGDALRKDAP